MVVGPVNLYRKLFQMVDRPVAFGIEKGVKIRVFLCEQFPGLEPVESHEPVGLIQAVFPEQRRTLWDHRQSGIVVDIHKSGIEYSLQGKVLV